MADSAAGAASSTLAQFLDTLPRIPCDVTPQNRYFCTICERLNKGVAARCKYSDLESDKEAVTRKIEGSDKTTGYMSKFEDSDAYAKVEEEFKRADTGGDLNKNSERVEFKVVAPADTDEEYPLIELIPPKDKKIKPIEMDLLENIALEFEESNEEPVEVEALEVEPLDDDYEESDNDDAVEVDAFEVEALEDIDLGEFDDSPKNSLPQFTPIQEPNKMEITEKGSGAKVKRKPKRIGKKRVPERSKKPDEQLSFKPLSQTFSSAQVPTPPQASGEPTMIPLRQPAQQSQVQQQTQAQPQTQLQPQSQPQQTSQPPVLKKKLPPMKLQPITTGQTNPSPSGPMLKPKRIRKVKK